MSRLWRIEGIPDITVASQEHMAEKHSVTDVFQRIKLIAADIVRSVEHLLTPNNRQRLKLKLTLPLIHINLYTPWKLKVRV